MKASSNGYPISKFSNKLCGVFCHPNYKTPDIFSHYTHSDNESLPLLPPTELLLLLTLQEMLTCFSPPDSYVNAHIN